jgi:hypothetical protein
MLYTQKECDFLIRQIQHMHSQLSAWEESFMVSVQTRRLQGFDLTPKQIETLSKIWDKLT